MTSEMTVFPLERKDGTYVLRLCLIQGLLPREITKKIMAVMDKYPAMQLRATTGQRMNLEGVPKDKIDEIAVALGASVGMCPPSVSVCPGSEVCKYGQLETRKTGDGLLDVLKANGPYPFKIKSGVSGCAMGCGQSFVRDIGLVGKKNGWDLLYGGSARHRAAPGIRLLKNGTTEEVLAMVERGLDFYKENGRKGERIGLMVRRLGQEAITDALLK